MNNRTGSLKANDSSNNFERSFASSVTSGSEITGAALSLTNDDDVEDLTSFIPPPMNVIKAEQTEQVIF